MTDRDSLIDSFVEDARAGGPAPVAALLVALATTLTVMVCGGLPLLDATGRSIRADYWDAIMDPMVAAKQVVPLLVLALAAPVALASLRPESASYPWIVAPLRHPRPVSAGRPRHPVGPAGGRMAHRDCRQKPKPMPDHRAQPGGGHARRSALRASRGAVTRPGLAGWPPVCSPAGLRRWSTR